LKKEKGGGNYSSSYEGVYLDNQKPKFIAYIKLNKKHHQGSYLLAADLAQAHGKCAHQLGISSSIKFKRSVSEYSNARENESAERGISVARSEVQAYLTLKVNNVVSGDDVYTGDVQLDMVKSEEGCEVNDNIMDESTIKSDLGDTEGMSAYHFLSSARIKNLKHTHVTRGYASKYNGNQFFGTNLAVNTLHSANIMGELKALVPVSLLWTQLFFMTTAFVLTGSNPAKINFASDAEHINSRVQEPAEKHMNTPVPMFWH
jgi:hypothetical protein